MYIAILGRQPAISVAELEKVFGGKNVSILSHQAALIDSQDFEIQDLGGTQKAGKVIAELNSTDWFKINQKIINVIIDKYADFDGKLTLGISVYDLRVNTRDIQKTGLILKRKLKETGVSLRLIPNTSTALNTAVSHHNKLGLSDNKIELMIVKSDNGKVFIATSTGAQNITAYANRDQKRPKRDAFVGMLPPKLAQIMVNLARPQSDDFNGVVLDPFCGTGVILQEAALLGYPVYGTDLSEKMIDCSKTNLDWLAVRYPEAKYHVEPGDAMTHIWRKPIGAVVCESYLGQPFSAPPSNAKLQEVVGNCNHIISGFLRNLACQVEPGTPLCVAVPAWRDKTGHFTHLPLVATIARLGYKPHEFMQVSQNDLLYYREDQVVARELLVLVKT
ncbi:hypothetical protein HGB24_02850 [Candidatus Saccharibacteria bacterium]|nr:hypothetical protein [Candidatus Saccharibacteria bacterium]